MLVVREDEDRSVIRRLVAPPPAPTASAGERATTLSPVFARARTAGRPAAVCVAVLWPEMLAADTREMQVVVRVVRIVGSSLSAALAAGLAILAVASFGAAVGGDSGDMSLGAVVMLGLLYPFVAAGAAAGAWKLWRRPATPLRRSRRP